MSSESEANPGFIEVPLEYFRGDLVTSPHSVSNSSTSICSDTTDRGSLSDSPSAQRLV